MPEPANLAKLAAFAGCDLEWLLTGHGRPPERGAMKRQRGAPASESPEAMRVQLVRDRLSSGSPDAPAHSGHPGNTPVMTAGGEERRTGSLGQDEADMALSLLQRALWAAVERDQQKGNGEGRDAVYRTLKDFSVQLFALGLFQVATEIAQMADRLREGGIVG